MKFRKERKSKMWKQHERSNSPAPKKQEDFLGALRAEMTAEARDFLRPLFPSKIVERDGIRFIYYPDGHVEVISYFDLIRNMIEEMKEFQKGNKRRL